MTVAPSSTARLLEGGPIATEIRSAVAEDVATFAAAHGRAPGLAVVIICGSRGTWIDDGRVDEPDVDQKSS